MNSSWGGLLYFMFTVVSDFDAGQKIRNIKDYISILNDTFLRRLRDEKDDYIRNVLSEEIHRRITRLGRHLVDDRRHHRALRKSALYAFGYTEDILGRDPEALTDYQPRPDRLFDDLLETDRLMDSDTLHIIQDETKCLAGQVRTLRSMTEKFKREVDDCKKTITELEKTSGEGEERYVAMFQKLFVDQDDQIMRLRHQMKAFNDCVNVSKGKFNDLLSSGRTSCPRASMLPLPPEPHHLASPRSASNADIWQQPEYEDCIKNHVKSMISYCEQLKLRDQQLRAKTSELEREQAAVRALVGLRANRQQ